MLFRLKQITATLLMASLLAVAAPSALAFSDAEAHWAKEVIEKADQYGLMHGYSDGTFGVGRDMSRAEFVTVLCRMMGWEEADPAVVDIPDIQSHWAKGFITAAAEHGVADPSAHFRPGDPISREEMAVMLVKALDLAPLAQSLENSDPPFPDVTEHIGYITVARDIGMTNGTPGPEGTTVFLPHDSAPREQAAAMLVRVYERYTSRLDWLHAFYAFSSYSQIDCVEDLDALSVGWARLCVDPENGPWINSTSAGGNDWVIPKDPTPALERFAQAELPYNLNVYADTNKTVTLADGTATSVLELLLSSEETAYAAIDALVAVSGDYAGLTIDFEGLRTETYKDAFVRFLADLRAALPPDKPLWVCVPPDDWYKGYDYREIGEHCDKVILMAHDYQWTSIPEYYLGTDRTHSPVTPIDRVYTALQHITDPDTGVQDKSKLALQISFGTAGFHVDENGLLVERTIYHPGPTTIAQRLNQEDTVYTWDAESRNAYIEYTTEDGEHYKLWFENAQSVDAKLSLAKLFGVTGVSVWRLGTVPIYPELEHYDAWEVFSAR